MKLHIEIETSDKQACKQLLTLASSLFTPTDLNPTTFSVTVPEKKGSVIDFPTPEHTRYQGSDQEKMDQEIEKAMKGNKELHDTVLRTLPQET